VAFNSPARVCLAQESLVLNGPLGTQIYLAGPADRSSRHWWWL